MGRSLIVVAVSSLLIAAAPSAPADDPDLSLTKTASPDPVRVGSDLTYTLTVTNPGPDAANDVSVSDTLPAGVSFGSASGPCTESAGTVDCDLGTVAAGANATITIVVAPLAPGTLDNSATVTTSSSDTNQSNNTDSVQSQAEGAPCTITGTWGPDSLTGSDGHDVLCGLGDDDSLAGRDGADVYSGGSGIDTAVFASAARSVHADLGAGTAAGEGGDSLIAIENIEGSGHDDVLIGSGAANSLSGLGGTDLVFGGNGNDGLTGGDGDDYLDGQGGRDTLAGGPDADTCLIGPGGGTADCPGHSRPDRNDTRGRFDAARVELTPGQQLRVRVRTFTTWSIFSAWDQGYALVWLDTRAGDEPDYFALVRSDGTRMRASLHKQLASGRDQTLSKLPVSHPDSRSALVTIPLSRVSFGSSREYYRWYVQTLWVGDQCHSTCFDRVDDSGAPPELRP